MKSGPYILLILLLLLSSLPMAAQKKTPAKLTQERKKLEEQITLTKQLLQETQNKREKSLVELAVLNKQISLREDLIKTLNLEMAQLTKKMAVLEAQICDTQEDIDKIKAQYAETARLSYKSFGDDNYWLAVLSASNLSEAWYRALYFRQFSQYRRIQIESLRKSQALLISRQNALDKALTDRLLRREEKETELSGLEDSRNSHNRLFNNLKRRESRYVRSISRNRAKLQDIISTLDLNQTQSKETILIGKTFERNKGFLPWPIPINRGIVVGKYGITTDPWGNRVSNDGIFIRTPQGQQARTVFKGKVTGVRKVPFSGSMVIIEHGKFRSVYANLTDTQVKRGDKVIEEQIIGTVRTDDRTDETVLQFMVYKIPRTFENPVKWLKDR